MGGEWRSVQLGELADIKHGFAFDGQYFVDQPTTDVLVTPGNFAIGGGFKLDKPKYYSGPVPDEFVLHAGDLVVTMTDLSKAADTLGYGAIVPAHPRHRFLHNQRVGRVVVRRPDLADPAFLHWALRTASYRREVLGSASGSTVKHTAPSRIAAYRFELPPLEEQRAIAHILGTLDDKIELNRRMNETLEAMARALFKTWFVDFGDDSTPDAVVSDLAHQQVLQVGDGYRAKNAELGEPGMPFARAGNIRNGFDFDGADLLHEGSVSKAGDKISRPYDVVFTSKGTVGRFAFVDERMKPFVYSPQLCFWRSLDHDRLNPFVLQQWMQSRWFLNQVDRVKGQTDMAEYVSLRDQRRMSVPQFPREAQRRIGAQLRPLQERVWANVRQSRTLAALRDGCLPRLLSGELSVADVKHVEGTA